MNLIKIENINPEENSGSNKDVQNLIICLVNSDNENLLRLINSNSNRNIIKVNSTTEFLSILENNFSKTQAGKSLSIKNRFSQTKSCKLQLKENDKTLSSREKEVLSFLALGQQYKQIAETLFISVHTVRFHIKNIYKKFNIHSQLEAVNLALNIGLV